MISEEYRGTKQWSRNRQAVFSVVWIAFLSAAIATMVFFAVFDPIELALLLDDELVLGREPGYAVGFLFFWLLSLGCAATTAFLVRTAPKRDAAKRTNPH